MDSKGGATPKLSKVKATMYLKRDATPNLSQVRATLDLKEDARPNLKEVMVERGHMRFANNFV